MATESTVIMTRTAIPSRSSDDLFCLLIELPLSGDRIAGTLIEEAFGLRYPRVDVVTCRLYRSGTLAEEGFDPERVSDHLEEPDALVWLDLEDPTEDELSLIEDEFGLHPLAVEDARHRGQRPKVEMYDTYFFLVMHSLRLHEGELTDQEVHAFVGPSYLVTLRYPPPFDLAPVLRRWERQPELTKEGGGFLLYALLDEVVDRYFNIVERFEDDSESIEEEVFAEEAARIPRSASSG